MTTPMVIHLYGNDGELEKTVTQTFVPWKMLKTALKVAEKFDKDNPTEEDIDSIKTLVIATFKDRITAEEIEEKTDLGEIIAVLTQIVATARGVDLNPTPPGK